VVVVGLQKAPRPPPGPRRNHLEMQK
jgi:hypothetical protein